MRAGTLDRLIDIERATITQDESGQPIETWTRVATQRPAAYNPVTGQERFTAEQFVASEQVEFTVRWASDLATLNPKDRVIYPTTVGSPSEDRIYDIMAVLEIGRQDRLRIMTVRRPEV